MKKVQILFILLLTSSLALAGEPKKTIGSDTRASLKEHRALLRRTLKLPAKEERELRVLLEQRGGTGWLRPGGFKALAVRSEENKPVLTGKNKSLKQVVLLLQTMSAWRRLGADIKSHQIPTQGDPGRWRFVELRSSGRSWYEFKLRFEEPSVLKTTRTRPVIRGLPSKHDEEISRIRGEIKRLREKNSFLASHLDRLLGDVSSLLGRIKDRKLFLGLLQSIKALRTNRYTRLLGSGQGLCPVGKARLPEKVRVHFAKPVRHSHTAFMTGPAIVAECQRDFGKSLLTEGDPDAESLEKVLKAELLRLTECYTVVLKATERMKHFFPGKPYETRALEDLVTRLAEGGLRPLRLRRLDNEFTHGSAAVVFHVHARADVRAAVCTLAALEKTQYQRLRIIESVNWKPSNSVVKPGELEFKVSYPYIRYND